MAMSHALRRAVLSRPSLSRCANSYFSTTLVSRSAEPSSPVLSSLRNDLKVAMRNKDTHRLSVLRALLADITNSSKTTNPITTDLQLLALLRKRTAASKNAAKEFEDAGREDLVEKEQAQIAVLDGYATGVEASMVGEEEIRAVVGEAIDILRREGSKAGLGDVVKQVLGPGGRLEGRMVEKKSVVSIVRELLGETS